MKRQGNFETLLLNGVPVTTGGGGLGQPTYMGLAYQLSDLTLTGGSIQESVYSNKLDPNSMLDISGGTLKFTVPAAATGLCRIKQKLSPQSSWNMTNGFVALPLVYKVTGNVYQGVGDRINGTWAAGANTNGNHFPYGELLIQLIAGQQYQVRRYIDVSMVNTGNGDTNFCFVEIW
jgi:hypothetical protein